jgi:acetyl esterase/lipase
MKPPIEAFHPELQKFASRMPLLTFSSKNVWLVRFFDRFIWKRKASEDILVENTLIPRQNDASRLRLRIYRQKSAAAGQALAPVLLWLHGGGYLVGKPEQDEPAYFQFVRELGLVIVSVDYRCAPEQPFPAALEDGYAALRWVAAHAGQLGVDTRRIAVGGASAGAGLAAALVQLACDRNEIHPVFQLLVYPMLDDRTVTRTDLAGQAYIGWDQASNRFGWESYLGKACGSADVPPYAVPARRADLSGLPPAWIGVGTQDMFYVEDLAYAQRLRDSGVECETCVVPGAFHGFDLAGEQVQVVREFRESQVEALRKYLLAG